MAAWMMLEMAMHFFSKLALRVALRVAVTQPECSRERAGQHQYKRQGDLGSQTRLHFGDKNHAIHSLTFLNRRHAHSRDLLANPA